MPTDSPVALVTGASRGAGRGIAIALGSHGCTVYVTGRSETPDDSPLPGTIYETAQAVTDAGGKGFAVRVDHSDDVAVETLFQQIQQDQSRLDILVNNACAIHDQLTAPGHFWEKPLQLVNMLDVGLRSGYVCCHYAVPLMLKNRNGLIVFTSASGSVHYVYGPVYGAHKAGLDKFAADMAVDLKGTGIDSLSIWMGALKAERLKLLVASDLEKYGHLLEHAETPEFTGHIIWHAYQDPNRADMSGQTVIGAELALKYGIKDEDGRQPTSYRDTHQIEPRIQFPNIIR